MGVFSIGAAMHLKWVLITGCSTGIGRALARVCREYGWGVVATARDLGSLADLAEGPNLRKVRLDVTDPDSIQSAVREAEDLPLHALVANAGYGQMGPLEMLRPEEIRLQFETNVIGLQVVTNAFLPLIRRCRDGEGRIVYVASVLGRLSIPMAGAYNASKHAVVALAETLRLEIGRRIPVILVEPGSVRSEFRSTLARALGDMPERTEGTAYHGAVFHHANRKENPDSARGLGSDECAKRIFDAMNAEHPPRRVIIGADSWWGQLAHRIVPAPLWEYILRRKFGL